ncbi:hypothetical protein GCM10018966_049130 [Streptomyces yanii]
MCPRAVPQSMAAEEVEVSRPEGGFKWPANYRCVPTSWKKRSAKGCPARDYGTALRGAAGVSASQERLKRA